jgi:energy-coupling factor transport system ATP-binding protein
LNALVKPTSGRVLLDGEDINADKRKLKDVRRRVGLVFQYPEHQLFEMTVYKDVAFGPSNLGLDPSEIDERVRESLDVVGIDEDCYEKSPFELSGGQKRRVAIAGALAMRPGVLILDEPTAGLDPKSRRAILDNIGDMRRRLKITVALVSHNMDDIAAYADDVIVMSDGGVAMRGTCADVFSRCDELEAVGLSAPRLSVLMDKLRKRGLAAPQGVYSPETAAAEIAKLLG